jgi:serine/threonine protein phosphatase PrpC
MNVLRRIMGQPAEPAPKSLKPEENIVTAAPEKPSKSAEAEAREIAPKPTDSASPSADENTAVEAAPKEAPSPDDTPLSVPAVRPPAPEKPRMIDLSDQLPPIMESMDATLDGVTRPLPQEVVIEVSGSGHAIFGQSTDMGRVRTNNEDSVYSFFATGRSAESTPDFGLFVVADGMGGHSEGERASAIAVRTVANHILRDIYLPLFNHDEREAPIAEVVTSAIQRANDAIVKKLEDGGTTVSAAVLIGDLAYIGHVGDSRVYVINRGKIERVTRDHSWVQRLIELDQLTADEAEEHPQKNLLYRALGQSDTLEVDTLMRRLAPNARMLLCSDGLWNQVSDADILEAVNESDSPQDACARLIALANEHGGPDNISVIVLHLPG